MLQLIAALFFLFALVAPLALIALTVQQSGRAILSALRGGRSEAPAAGSVMRLRIRPSSPAAPARQIPLRAAA